MLKSFPSPIGEVVSYISCTLGGTIMLKSFPSPIGEVVSYIISCTKVPDALKCFRPLSGK